MQSQKECHKESDQGEWISPLHMENDRKGNQIEKQTGNRVCFSLY
jgi:hypothetical protein